MRKKIWKRRWYWFIFAPAIRNNGLNQWCRWRWVIDWYSAFKIVQKSSFSDMQTGKSINFSKNSFDDLEIHRKTRKFAPAFSTGKSWCRLVKHAWHNPNPVETAVLEKSLKKDAKRFGFEWIKFLSLHPLSPQNRGDRTRQISSLKYWKGDNNKQQVRVPRRNSNG